MQSIPRDVSNKLASMSLLGAIFVVFIHIWTPTPPGSFAWWLYSLTSMRKMAVPLFFLISGFLLAGHVSDEDWWKRENSKRVKSLLIPYVLWSVLWMLFLVFRQLLGNYVQGHPLLDGVLLIVTDHRFLGLDLFSHPQMVPLWYVRALIILVFFSPVVVWLLKRCPRRFLCCAFLCAIFDRCAGGTYFYLIGSTFSISYLFYFAFGMALRTGVIKVPGKDFSFPAAIIAVAVWGLVQVITCQAGFEQSSAQTRFWLRRLEVLECMCWMYLAWRIIPSRPLPRYLAGMAFPIYLVHWFVLAVWQRDAVATVLGFSLTCIVGIGVSVVLCAILKCCLPKFSGVLFGGR